MAHGYRPDIDGLRALAVGAVLLFHLGFRGTGGGYVGVDVFFVISGYLITGLVNKELATQSFSFARFYLRRLRRLAPALICVSLVVTALAVWRLYPEDMSSFASSLTLQPLSLQNFFFLADGEYFRGAEAKPLLHTWSLAVEEQFYLFWPLLLTWLARAGGRTRKLALIVLFVGSFALGLLLLKLSPKASFFLLPPRAWELEAGALVAILEANGAFRRLSGSWRALLGGAGVLVMLAAVVGFDANTTFPGFAALLPVVGAVLYIVAGCQGAHPLGRVLAHPAIVHVGLISYPLYLWHWPVLVFWRYGHQGPPSAASALGMLVVSLVLAELTYRYVETPIRARRVLASERALMGVAGAVLAALVLFGAHARWTEGAAYRYSGPARALLTAPFHARTERCGLVFRVLHPTAQVCRLSQGRGSQHVLVWGNSHADMWSGLLLDLAAERGSTLSLNARNCRATTDNAFCGPAVQRAVLDFVRDERVTDVALISSWYGHYSKPDELFEAELADVVARVSQLGVRVWLVVDAPSDRGLDPLVAFRESPQAPALGAVPAAPQLVRQRREAALFGRLAARLPGVRVIDPSSAFCDERVCVAGRGEVSWYRDADHLTDDGAAAARSHFAPVFSQSAAPTP